MGSAFGRSDRAVADELFTDGFEFDFFQAVRLLEALAPEREAPGYASHPKDECVRFRSRVDAAFPASAVHSVDPVPGGSPEMTTAFFGLGGRQGVLPAPYTELLIDQQFEGDRALADFLDLFNHRLLSLFYRAWEKHHFTVGYERSARQRSEEDAFTQHLFDLIGLGVPRLRGRMLVEDRWLLAYAGLIAQQPHCAAALAAILEDYFEVPVRVEQFVGEWLPLDPSDLSYLRGEGPYNQLGCGAIAGDAVWSVQTRIRVRLGPLRAGQFVSFLPDGDAHAVLEDLVRFFAGASTGFDLQLELQAAETPACQLTEPDSFAPRLGWTAWLKTDEFEHNPCDAVFRLQ